MLQTFLFWIYLSNSIFLINHEIDSGYWNEWNLFNALFKKKIAETNNQMGINGFLIFHFPILFIVLFGLIEVYKGSVAGLIFSILLSVTGIFALSIHTYFIKKGNNEFKTPMSQFILISTGIISIIQLVLTIYVLITIGK